MDFFGIGAALEGVAHVYFRSAMRTGRTTALIKSLRPGDRVIFSGPRMRQTFESHLRSICDQAFADQIDLVVFDPKWVHREMDGRLPAPGRTFFDHTWIEEYYLLQIANATRDIEEMQGKLSTFPANGRVSRRLIDETIMRWHL
jgi:hypothetical protein